MSEHNEQATFFDWVRLNRKLAPNPEVKKVLSLCYAIPNGAAMKDSQRIRMFQEGMEKGIPDINLDYPVTIFCISTGQYTLKETKIEGLWDITRPVTKKVIGMNAGLRIEMKFGKNTLSKEQKEKKTLLEEAGFKFVVCYSAAEAVRAVFEYLPFKESDYQGVKDFLR